MYNMEYSLESLEKVLKSMRKYYGSGKTKEASWRESQLKGLHNFLMEREDEIFKALKQDLGKHQVEAFRDEVCLMWISLVNIMGVFILTFSIHKMYFY